MQRTALIAPWLVGFVALFATNCTVDSREVELSAPETTVGAQEPLYFTGTPWNNGVVPVCWEGGGTKDVATGNTLANADMLRTNFRRFVENSWGRLANITFTGWGACPTNPQHTVTLRWDSNIPRWECAGLGDPGASGIDRIGGSPFSTDLEYRAIHEMGHALGAHHEQQRPDNFDEYGNIINDCNLKDGNTPISGGRYLTELDLDSIMNYCGKGIVSAGDAIGMRAVYGVAISDIGMSAVAGAAWKVVGVSDFDGDGLADLAWRRQTDEGEVRFWLLDGAGGLKSGGDIGMASIAGAAWKVVGVGDFDGDGRSDLAWRRQTDAGEVRFWLLNGAGGVKAGGDIGMTSIVGADWKVVGVGDFDGDKRADLAWRRQTDQGEVRIWLLDGAGGVKAGGDIGMTTIADTDWKVVGVGDFNADGTADLAWRRKSDTEEVHLWLLNNKAGGLKEDLKLPLPGVGWKAVGAGDFNHDGKADLAWRRQTDEGEVRIWSITSSL